MKRIVEEWSTSVILEGSEPERICRLGQGSKCCAFLCVSPIGFQCLRMDYPANGPIFTRLEKAQ